MGWTIAAIIVGNTLMWLLYSTTFDQGDLYDPGDIL